MIRIKLLATIIGLLSISLSSQVVAQVNQEQKKQRNVELRFACAGVLKGSSKIQLQDGKPVQLRKSNPSKKYRLKVDALGKAHIFKEGVVIDEETRPWFSFSVPTNMREGLALLVPLHGSEKYKVMILNNQQFTMGAITFINLTKVKIGVNVNGENKLLVKARSKAILNPKSDVPVKLLAKMAYQDKEGQWKPFFSSRWLVHPTRKEMIILYYDPVSKRIRFSGISQFSTE